MSEGKAGREGKKRRPASGEKRERREDNAAKGRPAGKKREGAAARDTDRKVRPKRPAKEGRPVRGGREAPSTEKKKRPQVKEYAREVPQGGAKGKAPKGKQPRMAQGAAQAKPKKKPNKLLSLIWDITFYGFLIIILFGVVMFNFNDNPSKAPFGYRMMTVLTNSMSPQKDTKYNDGFKSGALVLVTKVNPKSLKVGDIITFNPVSGDTSSYLTHRVKKIHDELDGEKGLFFTTKGDANNGEDIPITAKQVVGKVVFHISGVGNVVKFLKQNIVVVAIFGAAVFAFFIVLKYYLGMDDEAPPAPRKKRALKQ